MQWLIKTSMVIFGVSLGLFPSLGLSSVVLSSRESFLDEEMVKSICGRLLDQSSPQDLREFKSLRRRRHLPNDPIFSVGTDPDFSLFSLYRSVSSSSIVPFRNSKLGYRILKKKDDEIWASKGGNAFFAPDGDPTWIFSALGPELAGFFGFYLLDENTMTMPSILFFNQRIRLMNRLLQKNNRTAIPVRFYLPTQLSKDDLNKIGATTYQEAYLGFQQKGMVPWAGNELVHDLSFHILEILHTEPLRQNFNYRAKWALQFAAFLRQELSTPDPQFPLLSNTDERELYIAALMQLMVRSWDNFSGLTASSILAWRLGRTQDSQRDILRVVASHLGYEFYGNQTPVSVWEIPNAVSGLKWMTNVYLFSAIELLEFGQKFDGFDGQGAQRLATYLIKQFPNSSLVQEFQLAGASEKFKNIHWSFFKEVKKLLSRYHERFPSEYRKEVVIYDQNYNVIESDVLGDSRHPVTVYEERIAEMKAALGIKL